MPASISSVTTMGYGNGTFGGSIALVTTLGYGIGAAVAVSVNDGWTAQARNRVLISESRNRAWIAKGKQ